MILSPLPILPSPRVLSLLLSSSSIQFSFFSLLHPYVLPHFIPLDRLSLLLSPSHPPSHHHLSLFSYFVFLFFFLLYLFTLTFSLSLFPLFTSFPLLSPSPNIFSPRPVLPFPHRRLTSIFLALLFSPHFIFYPYSFILFSLPFFLLYPYIFPFII